MLFNSVAVSIEGDLIYLNSACRINGIFSIKAASTTKWRFCSTESDVSHIHYNTRLRLQKPAHVSRSQGLRHISPEQFSIRCFDSRGVNNSRHAHIINNKSWTLLRCRWAPRRRRRTTLDGILLLYRINNKTILDK